MSRLIRLREMNKLHSWMAQKDRSDTQPSRGAIRKKTLSLEKDDDDWLEVGLLALY
jgi:hypothetical protein